MDRSRLFYELIKLGEFDNETLAYLIFTNRVLCNLIMETLGNKLIENHKSCTDSGDSISFRLFTLKYAQKFKNPDKKLDYDYCRDCHSFSKIKDDTCEYSCMITCCRARHFIPRDILGLIVLPCCKSRIGFRTNRGDDVIVCTDCYCPVIKNTVTCRGCNNIPIRYIETAYSSYNYGYYSDDSES